MYTKNVRPAGDGVDETRQATRKTIANFTPGELPGDAELAALLDDGAALDDVLP